MTCCKEWDSEHRPILFTSYCL